LRVRSRERWLPSTQMAHVLTGRPALVAETPWIVGHLDLGQSAAARAVLAALGADGTSRGNIALRRELELDDEGLEPRHAGCELFERAPMGRAPEPLGALALEQETEQIAAADLGR